LSQPGAIRPAATVSTAPGRAASFSAQLGVMWFGQGCTVMGATFVFPFLPIMVRTVGVTDPGQIALWSGLLIAGSQLCQTGAAPLWGRLADRVGRKPMVVRAEIGLGVILALTALSPNIWYLFAMRCMVGLFAGNISASNALVASLAPPERLVHSLGVLQSGQYVGTMAGPALGALFVPVFGIRPAFVVAAVLPFIAGVLTVFMIRESFTPSPRASRPRTRGVIDDAGIWRPLITLLVMALLVQSIGIALATAMPLRVGALAPPSHLAAAVGGAASLQAMCAAVAALTVSRLVGRSSHRFVLTTLPLLGALAFGLIAAAPTLGWMLVLVGVGGLAAGGVLPSINGLLGTVAPPQVRAELFGYSASAMALGGGAAPVLSGFLAARYGTSASCLFVASLEVVLAGWAFSRLRTNLS
jgi:DHA1 family multidrug resistance protein-like MFS transporter